MFGPLIPTIRYEDIAIGRDLFEGGLGFHVIHESDDFLVLDRGGVKVYIGHTDDQGPDRPEFGLETDAIDAWYADIKARRPDLLHPTYPPGGGIIGREYGAREFAVLDATTVCVVFRDWTPASS